MNNPFGSMRSAAVAMADFPRRLIDRFVDAFASMKPVKEKTPRFQQKMRFWQPVKLPKGDPLVERFRDAGFEEYVSIGRVVYVIRHGTYMRADKLERNGAIDRMANVKRAKARKPKETILITPSGLGQMIQEIV